MKTKIPGRLAEYPSIRIRFNTSRDRFLIVAGITLYDLILLNMGEEANTRITTIGGTLCVLLTTISSWDLVETIVLTTTGAVVSFVISQILRMVVKWWKARKG